MAEDHEDTEPRIVADRYELLRPVGRGGTGTVWLAHDRVLHRRVALKEIHGLPVRTTAGPEPLGRRPAAPRP